MSAPGTGTEPSTWAARETAGGYLGRSLVGHDFVDKVRGTLAYADDWSLPGMLSGWVVRAQQPAGRITSLNVAAARSAPGVVAVLTADDVPANEVVEEVTGLGVAMITTPVLARDRVRYAGEPVALVAADTPAQAEAAAELVEIDIAETPAVFDAAAALAPGAPLVHGALPGTGEGGAESNQLIEWHFERGDVERALAEADVVVEGEYRTHRVDHAYLEPEAGIGWVEGDGTVTLRVSTQVIEHAREIAAILRLPQSKVRVIGTYLGGGFGGKEDMTVEPFLALLVWATGKAVRMVWSRQDSLLARVKRHPIVMRHRTGARRDGSLVAQDVELIGDAGAYPHLSPRVMFAAGVTAAGPYRCPNVRVHSRAVFTNNVPTSAFRGFGAMQVVFGYESQMDRLARALDLSPEEIRLRNYVRKGDQLPTGETLDTAVALPETTRVALERLGPARAPSGDHVRVGRGFASNMQPYGRAVFFADKASCWMTVEPDGSLLVRAGVPDLGGGQAASLCQIAGEVLGVDMDRIAVQIADTQLTPLTGGTFATRQLYMSGNAALKTALELRDKLAAVAAEILHAPAGDLEFTSGRVRGGERSVSLADVVAACRQRAVDPSHLGVFHAEGGKFDPETGTGRTFPDFTFGTHACEVGVDTRTGHVRVLAYAACHDVGRAINPLRLEGQIQGGAVQGIGYALTEEIAVTDGTSQSMLFADYLIPAATDVPDIDVTYLESGEGKGPFNARGIGEPPIAPPAAALASAIEDAIGVRLYELPFTPDRILAAFDDRRD